MADPSCPSCGYDLRAQITEKGARCPECGAMFSREELTPRGLWAGYMKPALPWWPWFFIAVSLPPVVFIAMLVIGFVGWYELHLWQRCRSERLVRTSS